MTTSRSDGASYGGAVASAAPTLTAAVDYTTRGWRVFPLNGKVPLGGSNGCLGATSDPAAVALWPSGSNVGIATGRGLVVLDVDCHHGGGDSLADLERRHGRLPATVSAETGGGGEHHYFSSRARIKNSAGKLGPGLDVRGEGGYVVAPPSVHPDTGCAYVWDNHPDDVKLAPLPGWLAQLLAEQSNGHARSASEWRQLAANGATEGARNDLTARLAGHLLARGVDPFVALELVLAWNRNRNRPPLADGEVARTVESIARKEAAKWTG
jgi:hypothetical protein